MSSARMTQALVQLREALAPVRLPLPLPDAAEQQAAASAMRTQLDDYVLPRLTTIDAPLLAVVGGSTGAGKSTLVNSLVGRKVTTPGVIRPTTKSPVLIHHPDDERWFNDERILPGLIRSKVSSHDQRSLQLVAEPTLPQGLAILDAPDVDSVVEQNRTLAAQLLQAADLWLFVTSAARYADAVPWDYLRQAVERRAAVAVVLNRVPPAAMNDVPTHLGQMMTARGLAESPLFAVPETVTDDEGLLPDSAVSPVRTWLATLAADQQTRTAVVMQTLDGAIGNLAERAPAVASAIDDQAEALAQLRDDASKSFAEGARAVAVQSSDGTLLRGEVLTRWHDFIGTGEFMRAMEQKLSWLRDRVWNSIAGKPPEADRVKVAVESGLEALVREEGAAAVERAELAWRATPAGRAVLERAGADLSRPSPEFASATARLIRDWQGDVMELVAGEGMNKRSKARLLAFGINGAAVALMIVIFAHTAGLTGAEIGIAGGTSVVAQRLLEALIGDDAVRTLSTKAKALLDSRVEALMGAELGRFESVLTALDTDTQQAERIRDAVVAIGAARGADDDVTVSVTGNPERPALGAAPTAIESAERPALGSAADHRQAHPPALQASGFGAPPGPHDIVEAEWVEQPASSDDQGERRADQRRSDDGTNGGAR